MSITPHITKFKLLIFQQLNLATISDKIQAKKEFLLKLLREQINAPINLG